MDVAKTVERLRLAPHPEGGYYREVFRDGARLVLPDGRVRAASTAILYLLEGGSFSAFHRVRSAEVWHHYEGGALTLHLLGATPLRLDRDSPVAVVPAEVWQAAEPEGEAVLCGCTVAPGFEFADFDMGERAQFLAQYPYQRDAIARLTRTL